MTQASEPRSTTAQQAPVEVIATCAAIGALHVADVFLGERVQQLSRQLDEAHGRLALLDNVGRDHAQLVDSLRKLADAAPPQPMTAARAEGWQQAMRMVLAVVTNGAA